MVTELQAEHRSTEGITGAECLASVNYGCIRAGRGLAGDMEELHRCSGAVSPGQEEECASRAWQMTAGRASSHDDSEECSVFVPIVRQLP